MDRLKAEFRDKKLFVKLFGADIYAVGGYVRDIVRGRPSSEVDLLVSRHSLEDIIRKLGHYGKTDLVGRSFGIIKFTIKGTTYDIALPRSDAPKTPGIKGHKDVIVSADPWLPVEKDLERRDFRINSMALRLKDGALIDPFEGKKDARQGILRVTNPAAFPDDPLRVLRVARFASILGFKVDRRIYEKTKDIDLSGLSVERVNEEIIKILLHSPKPSVGLEELFKTGALEQIFPELYALTLCLQDSVFHPEKDEFGHHTVWQHTKLTVDQAGRLADLAKLDQPKKLCLLLAALFHDVGKPEAARWEYKRGRMVITSSGHDLASERIARKVLARIRIFTWNGFPLRRMIPLLIRTHHRASELWQNRESVTRKAFNRLAADVKGEIELLVYLDAADRGGRRTRLVKGLDREARWLLKKFDDLHVNRETIKPLVMGRHLIKMGVTPGPAMGEMLKKLYKMQLNNDFQTKTQAMLAARQMVKDRPR